MRLLTTAVALVSLCISGTWALHEADVGVVDWHKKLIGVPLSGSIATSPSFHREGDKAIILTATANNVLAALEPEDGSVLWRYIFDPEDRIAGYFRNATAVVATLSGPGGSTLRTFDSLNGQLIVEKRLHPPEAGALSEPFMGKHVVFSPDSTDLYVLSNGCTVTCTDGISGETKWTWTSADQSSLVLHSKLVLTPTTLYAVGLAKSIASYTLHVTSLSPATGEVITSSNIASSIVDPLTQFTVLARPDLAKPVALWLEQGALRYVGLSPNLKEKAKPIKGANYASIIELGLEQHGQAVVVRQDGSSFVLRLDGDVGYAKAVWEFEDSATSVANTDSMYAGAIDALGQSYVGRVYWSHRMEKGAADVYAGHLLSGQGVTSGFYFPFDSKSDGIITHAILDASNPSELTVNTRLLVTTSTGAVQLWEQSELKWTREESLATIAVAEVVEIPEKFASESGAADPSSEGFFARLTHQIADAQDFPRYLVNFAKRFATGSYASPVSASPKFNASEGLSRDAFGFRQVIVAASMYGKIFALDSSSGEIVWSRLLGLGWAGEIGGRFHPLKMFAVRTVSDGGDPEVVVIGQRRADNTLVDTVVFHVNALTGTDITGISKADSMLEGQDIIQGPLVEAYLLNHDDKKVVVLFDEFLQVYLYPDSPETQWTFSKISPALSFPLRTSNSGVRRVMGHKITHSPPEEGHRKPVAHPTWSLTLPPGEDVISLQPPAARGPVASFGKVLGNRTTLYKYLNPRMFTVLTSSPATATCGLYVVDSAKGSVIYRTEVKATLKGCEIKSALIENWLVYHYYEGEVAGGSVGGTTGYRMVSVEFYEGKKVDEKIGSPDMSSFSNNTLNFSTYERAYIFSHPITAVAATTTRFGISSRDLIVATKNHRVQHVPRRLLDPRRPNRKPTAEEQEEFLLQYDPVLPDDTRRVLSHNYDVANVQRIITSPALLESTSLVFAYGLDMFITRVAPSGTFDVLSENFNKAQLVFTVCGLVLAILITRPMVERKRLREKWYQ
ncbi:unnamed protein product [Cyclocybe aegerita]|uniref:ER membrane protein complex subunit 1 n=1 Tax=Cyclocybe aegerita TaxID=1973307 RepID=A0A8S0W615_CYCAE|nr:unnamed protein product [Cyclocybe aegerita]